LSYNENLDASIKAEIPKSICVCIYSRIP